MIHNSLKHLSLSLNNFQVLCWLPNEQHSEVASICEESGQTAKLLSQLPKCLHISSVDVAVRIQIEVERLKSLSNPFFFLWVVVPIDIVES